MATLRSLNAWFVRVHRFIAPKEHWYQDMLRPYGWGTLYTRCWFHDAHGIWFDCPCPKCQANEWGPTHVLIGFANRGAPSGSMSIGTDGKDSRWNVVGGDSLDNLQLSPSILLNGGCTWHGYVGNQGVPPGCAA